MKRLLITLLLALLAVATVVLWREWPCLFPSSEANELYRRYEHNDHIRATYIKDFQVNDTLRVDVTTVQALDSTGWEMLKKNFNIKPVSTFNQEAIDRGEDIVSLQLTPKDHPGQPMDTTDILRNNVMAVSQLHKTVSIFDIQSRQEIKAVCHSKYQQKH